MKAMFSIAILAGLLIVDLARPVWSVTDSLPSLLDCGLIVTCAACSGPWSVFLGGWGGAGIDVLHGQPFGVGIMTGCSAALLQRLMFSQQDASGRERPLIARVITFALLLFLLRFAWHLLSGGAVNAEWVTTFAFRSGLTVCLSVAVAGLIGMLSRSDSLRTPMVSRI